MIFLFASQILSMVLGIFCALVLLLFRRFGAGSWLLSCFLIFSSAVPGVLIFAGNPTSRAVEDAFRVAISFMLLATPFGLVFSWSMNRPDCRTVLTERGKLVAGMTIPVPILVASLYVLRPPADSISDSFVALGPSGYLASLYLLVASVMTLCALEQTIRGVEERVRWEIKFLILGMAGSYAAIIYVASKVLLYSFHLALVSKDAFYAFTLLLPISSILILASWRRSSGRSRIPVSQNLIYSSITLLSVGVYLIMSALFARWASFRGEFGQQPHAIIFLLSILTLAIILLWTSFRHRVRDWIRRNLLAGKYDYRHLWMEATEKVRSVDGPESTALALASIIQHALGAIDVSVWLRDQDSDRLIMVGGLGSVMDSQTREIKGILEKFLQIADPVVVEGNEMMSDNPALRSFCQQTYAALLVPMCSSNRLVGLLAVGSDRSGHSYNWEAHEFLRVIASHAASEFHKHELLGTLVAAKESEAFKSFSTFLLHDLKNFASTLSLIAKNASRHQGNPDFQRDAFDSIFDIAEKMKRLCNNLRAFSTNLASNRKLDDLNRIVKATANGLNSGLQNHLRLELTELPPVFVDAEEIARVIQNLFLNAREAISSDGSITAKTRYQDGTVELTVADNGIGMTPEYLKKELFLPFRTTKSDGLGIGLFQCKKIIEAHGGHIQVESEEHNGTAVRISFPIAARADKLGSDQQACN